MYFKFKLKEIDEDWEKKLRCQKFSWHNAEWIGMINSGGNDVDTPEDEYDEHFRDNQKARRHDSESPEFSDDDIDVNIGGSNALLFGP